MTRRPPRMTPNLLQATTRAYLNSPADEPSGSVPPPSGRYELGGLIATGGLGEVYRAWDRQLQRKLKELSNRLQEAKP